MAVLPALVLFVLCASAGPAMPPPPPPQTSNGTVTNASRILQKIPLKQLRLIVPPTPVGQASKAAVTLVFSRSVIRLGSNFDANGHSATVRGVHPLLWGCNGGSPRFPGGPPVEGRTWWVTTSILRFDPTESWGNNLRCTVRANPLLRSWDGAFLQPWTGKSAGFNTSHLALGQVSVSSELAAAATDGVWRSTLNDESERQVHECPSDCLVNVSLSGASDDSIDPEVLARHFCVVPNASSWGERCLRLKSALRRDGVGAGFTLVPPQPLKFDTVYNVTLPKGVVISNVSGPTEADITVQISGLRPFEFSYIQGGRQSGEFATKISSTQVSLFVRHGLPEEAPAKEIQEAVTVRGPSKQELLPAVVHRKHNDVTNLPSKTELRLLAKFLPSIKKGGSRYHNYDNNYSFASGAAVGELTDAFGLKLQQREASFSTSGLSSFFVQPDAFTAYDVDATKPIDLVALARGEEKEAPCLRRGQPECSASECRGVSLRAERVHPAQLEDVLMLAFINCSNRTAEQAVFKRDTLTFGPASASAQVQHWKFGELGPSWVLSQAAKVKPEWQNNCTVEYTRDTCVLYRAASFTVTVLNTAGTLVVLVASTKDATPIGGAHLSLYQLRNEEQQCSDCRKCACNEVRMVAELTTAADGFATFPASDFELAEYNVKYAVVAQHGGEMELAPPVPVERVEKLNTNKTVVIGDTIVDRALFNAGDTIHITGILRAYDWEGKNVELPTFTPSWSTKAGHAVCQTPWGRECVTADEYGIVSCVVDVPANATHDSYTVQVLTESPKSDPHCTPYNGQVTVTVADPRHPSATLDVSTAALLVNPEHLDAGVKLNISCQTYLGDKVKGASVQIHWEGTGTYADRIQPQGEYLLMLPTGATTDHALRIPRHVVRHLKLGTTLAITVSWLDATRDLLTKKLSVPVELSTWTVFVETNPPDNRIFAGFPFRATGTVRVPAEVLIDPEEPPRIQLELLKLDANGHPCTNGGIAVPPAQLTGSVDEWTLKDSPGTGDHPCGDNTPGECSRRQGVYNEYIFSRSLQLSLPDLDRYRLTARVVDDLGQQLNSSLDIGRNETQQALEVLMGWKQTFMKLYLSDADVDRGYVVGDTATVHWFNPLRSTVQVLLTWGNDGLKPRARQHATVPHGAASFSVPIGEECAGGCNVQAFVIVPSQGDAQLPVPQPKSQLFDLALPEADLLPSLRLNVGLDVPATIGVANLTITAPEHATAGQNVTIDFEVVGSQGQPADVGEIAVYVVDEALLDLLPYEIPALNCGKPYEPFENYVPDVTIASSIAQLGSGPNVEQALKSTEWRLDADPWTAASNWGVRACLGPLDIIDQLWMDSQVTPITYGFGYGAGNRLQGTLGAGCGGTPPPGPPGPPPAPTPAPAPPGPPINPGRHHGGRGGGTHDHNHPAVRKAFASTAFYQRNVPVNDGKAQITFRMPQNLGTWRVSAVAVSKSSSTQSLDYIKGETEFVSRLSVSLVPSMPRIGRVGEVFSGGCVIDSLTPGQVKLTVSQAAGSSLGSLDILSPLTQRVDVRPGEPVEVLWQFTVTASGQVSLEFEAVPVDESVAGDAFIYTLPLENIQQQVTLSTSFALLANRSFTRWTEGFEFPPAVPRSGTLSVAAGVGHFPAQRVLQDGIDSFAQAALRLPVRQWPDAFSLIAALAPPSVLNTYHQANVTSNVVMRLALLALREYTNEHGLQQIPCRFLVYPTYAQIPANAFALRVRREALLEFNSSVAYSAFETIAAVRAAEKWEQGIESALVQWRQDPAGDNSEYRWHPTASWWNELALARFGLGKEFPLDRNYDLRTNASVTDLKAHARMCDVERQAMIALVLLERNVTASDRKLVTDLSAQWYDHLRVQGQTAYVAAEQSPTALGLGTQALCLHVFALTKPTDPLVEKLANYVSAGPDASGSNLNRLYSFSRQDATYASFALAAYDRATGSASPSLSVYVAQANGSALFNASFKAGGPPAVHEDYTYTQIGNTDRLQFYALGTGEASVALSADFVPAQLEARPIFFGLFVQKSISLVNADGTTSPVNLADKSHPLRPGQIIQVTISVTSSDDQPAGVQVYDPLPGAFQAQDPLLKARDDAKASSASATVGGVVVGSGGNSGYNPYAWFPNSPWRWGFAQMDVFPDHVSCSTPYFSAGSSECIYTAEVVTSGSAFMLPPSHAFVPTRPGTMGLSGTATFAVAPRPVGPPH